MLKRLVLLILLLAGVSGWPLLAEEAGPADTSGETGQPPAETDSTKSGDKAKEPGKEEDEEPECD